MDKILDNFVVLEGGDGSGTSTQLALAAQKLAEIHAKNFIFHWTFEPSDGPIGTLIRSALQKVIIVEPQSLARLFAADRSEHLFAENGIISRCQRGELVICDRYVPSSLVYQGIECGDELPRSLNSVFPSPQMLLFFDIEPRIALERLNNRPVLEIYEHLEFQEKVRQRYHALLAEYRDSGVMVETIDASQTVEKVAEDVWRHLQKMPIIKSK